MKGRNDMTNLSIKTKYRFFLFLLLCVSVTLLSVLSVNYINKKIPSKINIFKNEVKTIDFNLPLTGEISSNSVTSINFNNPISFHAGDIGEYSLNVKLFGLFDLKTVTINVVEEQQLIPCGIPIGIYMKTDGLLVVNTGNVINSDGISVCPADGKLKAGDYITSINGKTVQTKDDLIAEINKSGDQNIVLGLIRNNESIEVRILPVKDASGEYKIGTWIRDDAQGIGTLTYIDANSNYGALGHGISDVDVGQLLKLNAGILYKAKVVSIVKGKAGVPGEFVGTIDYNTKNQIGTIVSNTSNGIFGTINSQIIDEYKLEPMDIGYKYEVHKGSAKIRTYVDNSIKDYEIEILDSDSSNNSDGKNITFKVTDPELLEITNGIVQGMSGSPIIQDNKIIGAVTHVFVDDSTMGYGIFIENMLNK